MDIPISFPFCEEKQLLNEKQAASFLGFTHRTLQMWRLQGGGPTFLKIGKKSVRYMLKDLVEWAESQRRISTSDTSESFSR